MLRGDLGGALGYNLLFPFFLGAIVVGWPAWVRAAPGWAPILWGTRISPWSGIVIAVVLGVLRNLTAVRRARTVIG